MQCGLLSVSGKGKGAVLVPVHVFGSSAETQRDWRWGLPLEQGWASLFSPQACLREGESSRREFVRNGHDCIPAELHLKTQGSQMWPVETVMWVSNSRPQHQESRAPPTESAGIPGGRLFFSLEHGSGG